MPSRPPDMKKSLHIAVADDHELLRKAICTHIETLDDFTAKLTEFADGQSLMKYLQHHSPDVIILDLEMPKLNGFEVLRKMGVSGLIKKSKVIVLSAHYNEFFFKELMLLGAASYLPKNWSSNTFKETLKQVREQGFHASQEVSREILLEIISNKTGSDLVSETNLSAREIEILELLCDGLMYKEIADKLAISVNTVKFHIKAIYKKTALNSNAALIKYAIRVGISAIEDSFNPKLGRSKGYA